MPLTAKKIDDLIDGLYVKEKGSGELRHLARLFSRDFLIGFGDLLRKDFVRSTGPYKQKVEVSIGYIDKIPVAEFNPPVTDIHGQPITRRTELGDAVFFFIDIDVKRDGSEHVVFASNLILQAKEADNDKLPKIIPIVRLPTTPDDSTLKELALLSNWPPFDLYISGNSNDPLQRGYSIEKTTTAGPQPNAWYIGAPPTLSSHWIPHWIAGPSQNSAPCDQSIGSLLYAILEKRGNLPNTNGVGKKFDFDRTRLNPTGRAYQLDTHASPPNWDDLCHQIILTCNKNDLPKSLFGSPIRSGRTVEVTVHVNPFGFVLKTVWGWLRALRDVIRQPRDPRRFPVVFVVRKAGEFGNF